MMERDEVGKRADREGPKTLKRTVKLAVLLLILVSVAHADAACDSASSFKGSNWTMLTMAAFIISFALIGIMYMAGKVVDNERLINMAKTDIQQTVITAVIVYVLFMPFVLGICSFNLSMLGFPGNLNIFDATTQYFTYTQQVATNSFQSAMEATILVNFISSIYMGQGWSTVFSTISFSPFAGLSVLNAVTSSMMNWLLLNIAVADAQLVLVQVIQASFLSLLLPAGVLLRALSPTRNIGGILISISLGLFLIHPLMFAISYEMIGAPTTPPSPTITNWSTIIYTRYIPELVAVLFAANYFKVASMITTGAVLLAFWPAIMNDTISSVTNIMGGLGVTLFYVLVIPGLAWIYIVTFVKDISKFMGEEIDISSLSRMV